MTCLLKRVLPFALTLVVGVLVANLWSNFPYSVNIGAPKYAGAGFGGGSSLGPHSDENKPYRAEIRYIPDIVIPDAARRSRRGFSATIRLEALLNADGTVSGVRPVLMLPYGVNETSLDSKERSKISPYILDGNFVMSLPYGLTEAAIDMVRKIEFTPAKIDGKPVTVRVTINSQFAYWTGPSDVVCGGCPIADTVIMEDGKVIWRTNFSPQ